MNFRSPSFSKTKMILTNRQYKTKFLTNHYNNPKLQTVSILKEVTKAALAKNKTINSRNKTPLSRKEG